MTTGLQLLFFVYIAYLLYQAWNSPWAIVVIAVSALLFLLASTPLGRGYPWLYPPK